MATLLTTTRADLQALRDAIAITRARIRELRLTVRLATGWDREHAIADLGFYLALQRRQVVRLMRRLYGEE
jgi:hypothetical protein